MALRASLTGHLVLSTLHTNSALGAVPRLSDLGLDPSLLEDALIGVLGQRLVRRVCAACARAQAPDERERAWLAGDPGQPRRGAGCAACAQSGYRGRTSLSELFLPDDACAAALRARVPQDELARLAARAGYVPLIEEGKRKVRAGLTTRAEVLRVCRGQRLTEDERAEL
jgi:type II secretory ATPase GspE/PulE/Tfp pilus assembly ATPase PilB-like protein